MGKINLITPPDSLFNINPGYLLVKPSTKLKVQFQSILSAIDDDVNVYIYDTDEVDIAWLLNAANSVDSIIIDVDNCDPATRDFISILMQYSHTFYMTTDDVTPWGLINRNRIYNLDWIVDTIKKEMEEDEDDYDEDDQ